ncbi:MAG: hypothetical protein QOE58_1383 [Actinomycetota bacterium]|jgi:hypothetical protein|nr:hypothetical protein [Actinomycetota bacterium]
MPNQVADGVWVRQSEWAWSNAVVPRYATPAGAQTAIEARERAQKMAAQSASGIPAELIALLRWGRWPGQPLGMAWSRGRATASRLGPG